MEAGRVMSLEDRVQDLERRVRALEAVEGVRHTLCLYARGLDEDRPELLERIVADDCRLQTIPWGVDTRGKDRVLLGFARYRQRFGHPRRYYANEAITVDGETAAAFSYWFVTQADGDRSVLGWGTYDWAFRLEDGIWKVTELVVRVLAMTTPEQGWASPDTVMMPFPPRPGRR